MKKLAIILACILTIGVLGFYGFRFYTKLASPEAKVAYEKNGLGIQITYCQPSKKGRVIFGKVVPYGKIWRTGANEATQITFAQNVKIAGKPLAAGTYSFYTIPEANQWTIIFNKKLGDWGSFNYKQENDVMRVDVPSTNRPTIQEVFTISCVDATNGATILLDWDNTQVAIPVEL
jgi:hypothetical protein